MSSLLCILMVSAKMAVSVSVGFRVNPSDVQALGGGLRLCDLQPGQIALQ